MIRLGVGSPLVPWAGRCICMTMHNLAFPRIFSDSLGAQGAVFPMKNDLRLILFLFMSVAMSSHLGLSSPRQTSQPEPLTLGPATPITVNANLAQPIDSAVDRDGNILIADFIDRKIVKLSPSGTVLWESGRRGEGPGEFNTLYRLAVANGRIGALDVARQDISWLTSDGDYVDRVRLPFRLMPIDKLLMHPNGHIVICGVSQHPAALGSAVHVFDEALRHLTSFGPLPPVEEERSLRFWGAGGCSVSADGDILYSRKIPYEIYRFSLEGTLQALIERPYAFSKTPDDGYVERRSNNGRVSISRAPDFVPRPWTAQELRHDWLVAGIRTETDEGFWDIFHSGKLVKTIPGPNEWPQVILVDRTHQVLYVKTYAADGNFVYLRVPYSL